MILTDYYKCIEVKPMKSHRLDCVASTGGYEPFETIAMKSKTGNFFCYLLDGQPRTFKRDGRRDAGKCISNERNISTIYPLYVKEAPYLGVGDTAETNDALLFKFSQDFKEMEVFVARGQKYNKFALFSLFADGELDDEMELLRERAAPSVLL